jgi:hypothetical protein
MPLEIAPGRELWEAQRGNEYVVFMDESFYNFFGFNDPNGNFCHGAVGLPIRNYAALQQQLAPLVQSYYNKFNSLFGHPPTEIKSSDLRRMPLRFQARFARVLARMLAQQGGFVSGFYTPTDGFIMEQVRVDLLGEAEEVPAQHQDLYEAARRGLLAGIRGPGQANLITKLLYLPVAAIKFMLGSFDCNFRIQYDPRQGDEDRNVREMIGQGMDLLLRMPDHLRQANNYQGMGIDRQSEDELGLQLADVIAGHIREFFRNNPAALTAGSTSRLITAMSDEPLQKFEAMEGTLFKVASLHPMPRPLWRSLTRRNIANLVSYYYPVLAAGMLTCNTSNGHPRDLELSTGFISDLLD